MLRLGEYSGVYLVLVGMDMREEGRTLEAGSEVPFCAVCFHRAVFQSLLFSTCYPMVCVSNGIECAD